MMELKMAQLFTVNKRINIWDGMDYFKCLIKNPICIIHERCKWAHTHASW